MTTAGTDDVNPGPAVVVVNYNTATGKRKRRAADDLCITIIFTKSQIHRNKITGTVKEISDKFAGLVFARLEYAGIRGFVRNGEPAV